MSQLKTKRRTFLGALAGAPALPLLFPGDAAVAAESATGRDVLQELGVRSFINAGGTFTA